MRNSGGWWVDEIRYGRDLMGDRVSDTVVKSLRVREPNYADSSLAIVLSGVLSFWVCRKCHTVRAYTKAELREIKGGIPVCTKGDGHETDGIWMQSYFMQKIEMEQLPDSK